MFKIKIKTQGVVLVSGVSTVNFEEVNAGWE